MKWYQFIGTTFSALAGKREVAMYADDDLQHWGRLGVRGALPEMGDDTPITQGAGRSGDRILSGEPFADKLQIDLLLTICTVVSQLLSSGVFQRRYSS